jgi:hypothetical protein
MLLFIAPPTDGADLDSNFRKAAAEGQVVEIQSFLEQGANVNSTDGAGRNALFGEGSCVCAQYAR